MVCSNIPISIRVPIQFTSGLKKNSTQFKGFDYFLLKTLMCQFRDFFKSIIFVFKTSGIHNCISLNFLHSSITPDILQRCENLQFQIFGFFNYSRNQNHYIMFNNYSWICNSSLRIVILPYVHKWLVRKLFGGEDYVSQDRLKVIESKWYASKCFC